MTRWRMLEDRRYQPNRLLDSALEALDCRSDNELSFELGVHQSILSRVRHKQVPISANTILAIMEQTGWSIWKVRELMGMPEDERF